MEVLSFTKTVIMCPVTETSNVLFVFVRSIVWFFVSLFVSLFGCLVVCVSMFFWPPRGTFWCLCYNLGDFRFCQGSIVAPGAPLWGPWGTCGRCLTLVVSLKLNFEPLGLVVGFLLGCLCPHGSFCFLF